MKDVVALQYLAGFQPFVIYAGTEFEKKAGSSLVSAGNFMTLNFPQSNGKQESLAVLDIEIYQKKLAIMHMYINTFCS